jgi:hypothetical protein
MSTQELIAELGDRLDVDRLITIILALDQTGQASPMNGTIDLLDRLSLRIDLDPIRPSDSGSINLEGPENQVLERLSFLPTRSVALGNRLPAIRESISVELLD